MNKYTLYSIVIFPIAVIILTTISTISFSNNSIDMIEKTYSSSFSNDYMEFNKKLVFNSVKNVEQTIEYEIENIEYYLRSELKDKLEIAKRIVQNIYKENKNSLSKKEMQKIVSERLSHLKFHNNEGYYFIFDSESKTVIGHPIKELIGIDFTHHKDEKGKPTLGTFIEGLKTQDYTFDKMYFYKPNDSLNQYPKLNSTFEFKELNLIIGTGDYLDTIEDTLKNKYLKKLRSVTGDQKINIYSISNDDNFLNEGNEGKISLELQGILKNVIKNKEDFYNYTKDNKRKQSYFYYLEEWGWIVESGFYIDDSVERLELIKKEINHNVINSKNKTKLTLFIILFITLIITIVFLSKLRATINDYTKKLNKYIKLIDKNVITSSTDVNGKITDASEAFCKISGYNKDEIIGHTHKFLRHEDMTNELYHQIWNTIISKHTWKGEIKNKKKDGTFYWVDAIISPNVSKENKIIGYTAIRQDITDKKRVEELSITDGLTTLYNRRHFDDIFPKALNGARREKEYFCFILMDIDHFKQYNDTYGHQKGDEVLIKVAACLKDNMKRANDLTFRLGGEEFGVLFKTDEQEKASIHANNLRNKIEKLQIEHKNNSASTFVTMSMGLICDRAENLPSFDKVYRQADELLYKAKESGRNKVVSNKN